MFGAASQSENFVIAKNRDGEEGPISDYNLAIVELGEDEDGEPITSCVIEPPRRNPRRRKKPSQLTPAEKAFEDAFNECAIAEPIKYKVDGDGPEVTAVDAEKLKAEFFKRHPSGKEAARKTWDRHERRTGDPLQIR